MKYILLFFTITFLLSTMNPKNFKRTLKTGIDEVLSKGDKNIISTITIICLLIVLPYFIVSMLYVGTLIFSVISILYIYWSVYDCSIILKYVNKEKEHKLLDNKYYRILSKPFDLAYYGYVIYYVIIHW